LLDDEEKPKSAKTLLPCARCPTRRKAAGTSPPNPKPERSKLLRFTPQFLQLINAALFAPHPPKLNQPTLPGVLPVKAGEKGSNPHAPFSPAFSQKAKDHNRRKNPGTPPLADRNLYPQSKHKGQNCSVALRNFRNSSMPPSDHISR
jgi:hypothetical protein